MKIKVAMMWSGGKDSAFALHRVLQDKKYEVCCLLSTFSKETNRLLMHGVAEEIIDEQAKSIGLPLIKVFVENSQVEGYEKAMEIELHKLQKLGVNTMVFGDLFLEDLRQYREKNLEKIGAKAYFPLWGMDTKSLINEFIAIGFKTICCCVNLNVLSEEFLGKIIDNNWVSSLPKEVDPCGENGEYHSCCIDGPIFKSALSVENKEVVIKAYPLNEIELKYSFVDIQLHN